MANGARLVIGLTGPVGSGVSTVSRTFESLGFHRLCLSDAIKSALREKEKLQPLLPLDEAHVPGFRQKLQDIGNEGRRKSLSHWVDIALKDDPGEKDLVVDGIRNLAEVRGLRERFPRFFLASIHASPAVRWNRLMDQYQKNLKQFERDDQRDSHEDDAEGQQVADCVQHADYSFINEDDGGSTSIRGAKLTELLQPDIDLMRHSSPGSPSPPFLRPATPDEVHMATAHAQSQNSRCIKRLVGAVIVDQKNLPLSLGYNENPVGMAPCITAFRHCYKDEDMHRQLEQMGKIHCPGCGTEVALLAAPWTCPKCRENLKLRLFPSRNMELCTAVHAEERAIKSLAGRDAKGSTIYTTTFPCFQCSRSIVDAGIQRVVYVEAYPVKQSLAFLERNQVVVDPFGGFKARAFNLVFRQRE
jgi:deoxycytidylate deaminase/dephospho-CoA kinase